MEGQTQPENETAPTVRVNNRLYYGVDGAAKTLGISTPTLRREIAKRNIRNPAEILRPRKKVDAERDFWTPGQVDRILDRAPDKRRRLLWAFMAFAGLRIHEALKAVPSDIRDGFLHVVGKGGKFAKVPLSSRMRSELDRVGWKWDFSGLTRDTYAVEKAAKEAVPEGFPGKANNHRFRHSFASNLVRGGANPKAVQRLMRHSSIQTTLAIYSHVLQDDLSGELEKMFGNAEKNTEKTLKKR